MRKIGFIYFWLTLPQMVYNPLKKLIRGIKEMATYWTSIGVMLIPVGLAILIQWPDSYPTAFIVMSIGLILGAIGLRFTIRDEKQRQIDRVEENKRREAQEKQRTESHYLDRLIQQEILKALGVNPRLVSRSYRRWLSTRKWREQLKKIFAEGEEAEKEKNEV